MANGQFPIAATLVPAGSLPVVEVEAIGGSMQLRPCKYRVINSYTWNPAGFNADELDGASAIAVGDRLLNVETGLAAGGIYVATSPTTASLSTTDVLSEGKLVYCVRSAIKGPFMFVE